MSYQSIKIHIRPLNLFGLLVSQNHRSSQDIKVFLNYTQKTFILMIYSFCAFVNGRYNNILTSPVCLFEWLRWREFHRSNLDKESQSISKTKQQKELKSLMLKRIYSVLSIILHNFYFLYASLIFYLLPNCKRKKASFY